MPNSSTLSDPASLLGVSAWLSSAISPLTQFNPDAAAEAAGALLDADLGNLYAPTIGELRDAIFSSDVPELMQLGIALQQQLDAADAAFTRAKDSAVADFIQARDAWSFATEKEATAILSHGVAMRGVVDAASADFKAHANHDSRSRFAAQQWAAARTFAGAEQTRLTDDAAAISQMADAANAMIGAYAKFMSSVRVATAGRQVARNNAWSNYWDAVSKFVDVA